MRNTLLVIVLMLISTSGRLFAQSNDVFSDVMKENEKYYNQGKTEKMFNIDRLPCLQDFVYLKNGKMILELQDVTDYTNFKNFDSILMQLRSDIAFYKDSLENGIGNVRIDYRLDFTGENAGDNRSIRFIKYNTRGDIYVKHQGETERLKIEQDTIRLLFQVLCKRDMFSGETGYISHLIYPIQVTFVLNNYTDIDKVIAEKEVIRHVLDTLPLTRDRRETRQLWKYSSSTIYHPYFYGYPHYDSSTGDKFESVQRFVKYPYLLKNEYGQFRMFELPQRKFGFYANIGSGVVRNTLSPNADIGLTYFNYWRRGNNAQYSFTSLYISPFFLFAPDNNNGFYTYDNWFINIESGSTADHEMLGVKIRGFSVGAGYLAFQKGDYFTGTTIKAFASLPLLNGITVSPELIATNNFKQIFPGINFKVFGNKRS